MSIEVRNITKSFGNFAALENVSLDLPTGELIALLGPSGCGKTTLLRIIAGLEQPDSGSILLAGQDASTKHVRERSVGFVFQHYALFRHMTVFENIAFGLRVKPRGQRPPEAQIRAKVLDLLELVQLTWLKDRYPSQLSGGQRQRTALARALAVEPEVLLLDEPFGALDAKVRKELRRWLRRLHDDLHITSVFVTHDQEEALEVSDKIVLMNKGRVEQTGTPKSLYEQPATAFAYSFIGTVNAFKGQVEGDYLRVGEAVIPHGETTVSTGRDVIAFARPHQLAIVPTNGIGHGIPARINRIHNVGTLARVELVSSHATDTGPPEYFEVEMPREEVDRLALHSGQAVRVAPSKVKLFDRGAAGSVL